MRMAKPLEGVVRGASVRRFLAGWRETFAALRYREFRLFWAGLMGQVTGQQITIVTLGWLAYDLTKAPLALGVINLLTAAPRIAVGLLGGVLADRFNPRGLIVVAQTVSASVLVAIATLTVIGYVDVWHLACAAFLLGLVQSFDEPSRAALFPRLLPDRSLIPAAAPLISVAWSSTRIVAPSIAGFIIAAAGAGMSFYAAAAGAATMVAMMRLVRAQAPPGSRGATMFADLKAGVGYVWRHPIFRPLVVLAFVSSAFGQGYVLTLPLFQDALGVDSRGLGSMYSALGVGSMIGLALYSRAVRHMPAGGVALASTAAFAVGLIAFAASPWFILSLAALLGVGAVGVIQITSAQVMLQTMVADKLRGRVMALHGMHWGLLPVGGAIMNSAAEVIGGPKAVAAAALALLAITSAVALRSPVLRRLAAAERLLSDDVEVEEQTVGRERAGGAG